MEDLAPELPRGAVTWRDAGLTAQAAGPGVHSVGGTVQGGWRLEPDSVMAVRHLGLSQAAAVPRCRGGAVVYSIRDDPTQRRPGHCFFAGGRQGIHNPDPP